MVVAIENCLERNRRAEKVSRLPQMVQRRAYLQKNLKEWKKQYVDVNETIFRTKIEQRILVKFND